VGAGAAGFGGLVGTLHDGLSLGLTHNLRAGRTRDYNSFPIRGQHQPASTLCKDRVILGKETVDNPVRTRLKRLRIRLPRKDLSTT
jgi:hypothetical protein